MNCPRCHSSTREMNNHGVTLDVCFEGCGGIWFDHREIEKMDEELESDEAFLEELSQSKIKKLELSDKINCPKCDSQPMFRHFWSVNKSVEIDECPVCGGFWLDAGELTHIYSLFKTTEEREAAADQLFDDVLGGDLAKLSQESQEGLAIAKSISSALRFICPSYKR